MIRRDCICFIYCLNCTPARKTRVDFRKEPWSRFHNYPTTHNFACEGCGGPTTMHVHPGLEAWEQRQREAHPYCGMTYKEDRPIIRKRRRKKVKRAHT